MGMFDEIECKYPLPLPEDPKGFIGEKYFQTKDFDCALDKYIIREDGTLWIHKVEYEYPENYDFIPWTDVISEIKEKKSWLEPVKVTTSIRIYNHVRSEGEYDYWIQYNIKFADGIVNDVSLEKFDAYNNAERKRISEENIKRLKEWNKYTKTIWYKYIHRPYNYIIRFTFGILRKVINRIKISVDKIEIYLLR